MVSIPLDTPIPTIAKICGTQSGPDIDKAAQAHLTLEDPTVISVPGIKEYPLTLECRVLYSRKQDLEKILQDIRDKMYPQDVGGSFHMANHDAHTAFYTDIILPPYSVIYPNPSPVPIRSRSIAGCLSSLTVFETYRQILFSRHPCSAK